MSEWVKENNSESTVSIYKYKKHITELLQSFQLQLEQVDTTDLEVAKLQYKIELYKKLLDDLQRLD